MILAVDAEPAIGTQVVFHGLKPGVAGTDSTGTFIRRLEQGTYVVSSGFWGAARLSTGAIQVVPGDSVVINFRLPPGVLRLDESLKNKQ